MALNERRDEGKKKCFGVKFIHLLVRVYKHSKSRFTTDYVLTWRVVPFLGDGWKSLSGNARNPIYISFPFSSFIYIHKTRTKKEKKQHVHGRITIEYSRTIFYFFPTISWRFFRITVGFCCLWLRTPFFVFFFFQCAQKSCDVQLRKHITWTCWSSLRGRPAQSQHINRYSSFSCSDVLFGRQRKTLTNNNNDDDDGHDSQ